MRTFRATVHLHICIILALAMVSCAEGVDERSDPLTQRRTLDNKSRLSSEWKSTPTSETVQTQLTSLGYDPGTVDGVMGPKTRAAIKRFQQDRHLIPSGQMGPVTTAYLMPASVQQVNTFLSRKELRDEYYAHSSGFYYSGYISPLRQDAGGYNLLSTYPHYTDINRLGSSPRLMSESSNKWR